MIACRVNASELLEEADILAEKGRKARAYFLLHTACEELGKFAVLEIGARGLLSGRPPKWKRFWQRFRSHDSKSAQLEVQLQWLAISTNGADDFSHFAETIFGGGLQVRNAALYVDQSHERNFRKPSDIDFGIPLGGLRALTVHALAASYQRGKDFTDIEAHLRVKPDEEAHRTTTKLLIKVLERCRDAGMDEDKARKLIDEQFK